MFDAQNSLGGEFDVERSVYDVGSEIPELTSVFVFTRWVLTPFGWSDPYLDSGVCSAFL